MRPGSAPGATWKSVLQAAAGCRSRRGRCPGRPRRTARGRRWLTPCCQLRRVVAADVVDHAGQAVEADGGAEAERRAARTRSGRRGGLARALGRARPEDDRGSRARRHEPTCTPRRGRESRTLASGLAGVPLEMERHTRHLVERLALGLRRRAGHGTSADRRPGAGRHRDPPSAGGLRTSRGRPPARGLTRRGQDDPDRKHDSKSVSHAHLVTETQGSPSHRQRTADAERHPSVGRCTLPLSISVRGLRGRKGRRPPIGSSDMLGQGRGRNGVGRHGSPAAVELGRQRRPGAPHAAGLRGTAPHRRAHLRRERPEHTLQPTALVHEAYLKLVDQRQRAVGEPDAVLRRRRAADAAHPGGSRTGAGGREAHGRPHARHAGRRLRPPAAPAPDHDLLELNDALDRLAALDERQARVVELRYFGGLDLDETATAVGASLSTVKRDWTMAKAWLYQELKGDA